MNRFLSVLMLMCGLLLAGGAHAIPVTWTIPDDTILGNCDETINTASISGTFVWDADTQTASGVDVTVEIDGVPTNITTAAPNLAPVPPFVIAVFSSVPVTDTDPTGWVYTENLTNDGGTEDEIVQAGFCVVSNSTCDPTFSCRATVTLTGSEPASTYTIGGTISGLTGSGLELTDSNAGSSTITAGATSFTLPNALNSGSDYAVSVQTQPTGQTCTVSNGSGTNITANVTTVSVTCTTAVPAPNSVPTLSEWAQMALMLMLLVTAGWYGRRMKQG